MHAQRAPLSLTSMRPATSPSTSPMNTVILSALLEVAMLGDTTPSVSTPNVTVIESKLSSTAPVAARLPASMSGKTRPTASNAKIPSSTLTTLKLVSVNVPAHARIAKNPRSGINTPHAPVDAPIRENAPMASTGMPRNVHANAFPIAAPAISGLLPMEVALDLLHQLLFLDSLMV